MVEAAPELRFDDGLPRPDKHMPGLDCLRGIAILMVVVYHGLAGVAEVYGPVMAPWQRFCLGLTEWGGTLGVRLFFVLSGFLITGILLDTRTAPDYYKRFYSRRAVRILPALLLFLFVLKVTHGISWTFLLLALFFVANMGLRYSGGPVSAASPLWTLSVEEQFYLFWPTVIHKFRPRVSAYIAIGLVAVTPLIRFVLLGHPPFNDVYYKTWGTLDFFAAGALVSMLLRFPPARCKLFSISYALFGVALLGLMAHWLIFRGSSVLSNANVATFMTPWAAFFSSCVLLAFLVPAAAKTWVGRALAFFGYISYGLYLYHGGLLLVMEHYWKLEGVPSQRLLGLQLLRFLVGATVSVGVAWLSRSTFEAYFLKMKPHQKHTAKAVTLGS